MNISDKISKNDIRIIILFSISLLIMIVLSIVDITIFDNQLANEILTNSISRFIGGVVLIVILCSFGYKAIFKFNGLLLKSLMIVLPGIFIAVNNFPIIAYFDKRAAITEPTYTIYLFIIECISIGFFEEVVFRGIILIFLLQRFSNTKKGMYQAIVLSSALFGLIHLVNIFSGADVGSTILQIGYSFLMGMMWAIVYLKTRNIWYSILLHATYNFFGLVLFRLGYVNGRFDNITIITTVLLALVVSGYMLFVSFKIDPKKLQVFVTATEE
jgi:membrane protease YdiL (CAAX protease family)